MKEGSPMIGEPLVHNEGKGAAGGIWRVREPAGTRILKVACPPSDEPRGRPAWPTSDEPTHWNYWRRETLAYRFRGPGPSPSSDPHSTTEEVFVRRTGVLTLLTTWAAKALA